MRTAMALAWLAAALPAHAQQNAAPNPACDPLVQPQAVEAHSGHRWRPGPGLWLYGDKLACNWYQDEVPAGLLLSVRPDPQKQEFDQVRREWARNAQPAEGFAEAFYFRHDTQPPFEPSWSLIAHAKGETYRIEGIPEAGNADGARKLARQILVRVMQKV